MDGPIPLRQFFEENNSLSKEEFLLSYIYPFLIFEEEIPSSSRSSDLETTRTFSILTENTYSFTPVSPENSFVIPLWSSKTPFSVTIGRDYSADIRFPFPDISAKHAQIFWDEEKQGYCICDLNSSNGTYLNSQILLPGDIHRLQDQDVIRLGSHILIFYLPETLYLYISSSYW